MTQLCMLVSHVQAVACTVPFANMRICLLAQRFSCPIAEGIESLKNSVMCKLPEEVCYDVLEQAMLQSMKVSRVYHHEHLLAATVEYECKIRGAQRMA